VKKSLARIASAGERGNWDQVGAVRRGAGPVPAFFRIFHAVDAAIFCSQAGQFAVDPAVTPFRVLLG
jgi:hypothetical protein